MGPGPHAAAGELAERRAWPAPRAALRSALDGTGLRLLVHAPDDLSAGTTEHDRAFDGLLDYAATAGAELVAYHGLNFAEAEGPAAARLRERAQLEERSLIPLLQRAHSLGLTVAIENLAPVYSAAQRRRSHDPLAVRDLVRRLDQPAAGMLLDLGHLHITADATRSDHAAVLAACAPTSSCSTCTTTSAAGAGIDAPGVDPIRLDLHLPPGRGSLPWARIAGMVAAHEAPVMLEVERSHRPRSRCSPRGHDAAAAARGAAAARPERRRDAGRAPAVRQDGGVTIVPLTSLSHGAGCGCKLPAADAAADRARPAARPTTRGCSSARRPRDDAAVYRLATTSRSCRRSTSSRRSSTTRTTSGGSPRRTRSPTSTRWAARRSRALNLVAFPLERARRRRAARDPARRRSTSCAEAGAAIVGGHSIDDPEPKYGLAVTGLVDPERDADERGRRAPGDVLVLTKPLGVGAIVTARKRGARRRRAPRRGGRRHDDAERRRRRPPRSPRARTP